ncbi:MAG: M28 family peptidase [Draconibacterium sp.]|nr:M28 family peptidase [Draconibacterium sp.]
MKLILLFAFQSVFFLNAFCQDIQTLINRFNQDSLLKTVRELSGEDSVIINGTNTIITYRAAYIGSNLTEDYLKARLSGYGLNVQTQKYSINGLNVFGIQEGTKFPNEAFIVGAHHDAVTFYCADDNASGCAAVMETARILSETSCDYTIIYAFWDEEEAGLWGSNYQAKQARQTDN